MGYPNKYAGECARCGTKVGAGAGEARKESGSWRCYCRACAETQRAPSSGTPTVIVETIGREVSIRPDGFLGPGLFQRYRAATEGARFEPKDKSSRVAGDVALRVFDRLRAAGFVVRGEIAVADALAELQGAGDAARAEAAGRADEIDAILRARGLGLYAFQRLGVEWLAGRDAGLLADEMGVGKTIQALAAVPKGVPILVICPAVAKGVWMREAARWRPDLRLATLAGKKSFRWPEPGELVATNYDILDAQCGKAPAGTVVLVDEAHACKSHKAQRTKAAKAIVGAARAAGGKCFLLTATPLLNRPTELWGVLSVAGLEKEAFGGWHGFLAAFNGVPGRWGGYVFGAPQPDVPDRLARVMLRRRKADVLKDLPAKTYREVPVDLDAKTVRECEAALQILAKRGLDLTDPKTKLPSGGIAFEEMSRVRAILAAAKIPAMLSIVEEHEEASEPLIVMSAHRAPIDLLGDREGWATITGDTSAEERTRIEQAFQAGALRGVACTIKAGGVAITLTRSSNVLFVDRDWTPALNWQAEDRAYRIGQNRAVLITTLIGAHVLDERVHELLMEKAELVGATVDAASTTTAPALPAPVEVQPVIPAEPEDVPDDGGFCSHRETSEVKVQTRGKPREARTAIENWAAEGLCVVASLDGDRAKEENGVGFSKMDGGFGHDLVRAYRANGLALTEAQWSAAVKLARRYRGQIGDMPAADAETS